MEHIRSSFYFIDKKQEIWQVNYMYNTNGYLKSDVFLNNELLWQFESVPNTRTQNPTKSQAREIITQAKKMYKQKFKKRDDRENILNKLGI